MVPVAALAAAAPPPAPPSALSASQLRLLAAFVDRIIPKDELGPSASECDVPVYINRTLGDYLAGEKRRSSKVWKRWSVGPPNAGSRGSRI